MEKSTKIKFQEWMEQLDKVLTEYLTKKAPPLPVSVKEFIVNFGPWISLILGLMMVPAVLSVFDLGAVLTPLAIMSGVGPGIGFYLGIIFALGQMGLQFAAIPGLLKKQLSGWTLVFYGILAGGVYYLLIFNLLGLIIGVGLGLYVLYQIKGYYK